MYVLNYLLSPWQIGAVILLSSETVPGSGPIFLDQLDCSVTDSFLLDCSRLRPLGLHTCDHSQDVGLACIGKLLLVLRLPYSGKFSPGEIFTKAKVYLGAVIY